MPLRTHPHLPDRPLLLLLLLRLLLLLVLLLLLLPIQSLSPHLLLRHLLLLLLLLLLRHLLLLLLLLLLRRRRRRHRRSRRHRTCRCPPRQRALGSPTHLTFTDTAKSRLSSPARSAYRKSPRSSSSPRSTPVPSSPRGGVGARNHRGDQASSQVTAYEDLDEDEDEKWTPLRPFRPLGLTTTISTTRPSL